MIFVFIRMKGNQPITYARDPNLISAQNIRLFFNPDCVFKNSIGCPPIIYYRA